MRALLRSEWIKARTVRVNFVLTAIGAGFPIIIVTLVAALGRVHDDTGTNLGGVVTGTMTLTSLLFAVVGALNLTSEFSHGTIRVTFAATPQRSRVLLAKAAVSVMATIVAMLVVEVVSFLIGALILDGRGVDVKLRHQDVAALVGEIALAVMLTLLGYGLGLLIRNSPATISILILWPLLLESLVRVVLNAAGVHNQTPWLPYQSAILLGNPDPDPGDPGRLHNVLYLGTIVVVCVIFGLFLNERRDA